MSSDDEARSTERPPAGPDIASAIVRAKSNESAPRSGPALATAKMNKFDLAHALALTTSEDEARPSSSQPLRDDGAMPEPPSAASEEISAIVPAKPASHLGVAILAALVGAIVIGYVYATTR